MALTRHWSCRGVSHSLLSLWGPQVRKEREFRLLDQKRKIEMDARKMEALADMKIAMLEERVAKKREERIEFDKWREETVFLRAITPVML